MSQLVLRNISRTFGDFVAVDGLNLSLPRANWSPCWGPRAAARRRRCGGSPASSRRAPGPSSSWPADLVAAIGPTIGKAGMSMIFQSYAIWPKMTVEENVAFGLKLQKVPPADAKQRLDKMLDVVKLKALRDRYPTE